MYIQKVPLEVCQGHNVDDLMLCALRACGSGDGGKTQQKVGPTVSRRTSGWPGLPGVGLERSGGGSGSEGRKTNVSNGDM